MDQCPRLSSFSCTCQIRTDTLRHLCLTKGSFCGIMRLSCKGSNPEPNSGLAVSWWLQFENAKAVTEKSKRGESAREMGP